MFVSRIQLLIATLWVGSLWTVGYIVAPTLFAILPDRAFAGVIAGRLFCIEAWLSVFCAIVLIALVLLSAGANGRLRKCLLALLIAMLTCVLIGYFGVQPFMAALREGIAAGRGADPASKTQFGILHGVSSAFYLTQSLLGIMLILKIR